VPEHLRRIDWKQHDETQAKAEEKQDKKVNFRKLLKRVLWKLKQ